MTKKCNVCKNIFPLTKEYFYIAKSCKDGFRGECKKCSYEKRKNYFKDYSKKYNDLGKGKISGKKYRNTIKGCLLSKYRSINIRCGDPENSYYKNYGGRGIKNLFVSSDDFIDYVINELQIDPRKLHIHRIDNNKGYEKGNIEFISMLEHSKKHNKSKETGNG